VRKEDSNPWPTHYEGDFGRLGMILGFYCVCTYKCSDFSRAFGNSTLKSIECRGRLGVAHAFVNAHWPKRRPVQTNVATIK
jgi:hypothetical protein